MKVKQNMQDINNTNPPATVKPSKTYKLTQIHNILHNIVLHVLV